VECLPERRIPKKTRKTMSNKIRIGITQGDINGIGYEVILKILEDNRILELCTPVVYGSAKIAAFYRKMLDLGPVQFNQIAEARDARDNVNNIINVVGEDTKVEPGVSSQIAGQAAFVALERAVADLKNGDIDALVTAPINKHNIQSDTFTFPGHTEYLEASVGDGNKALMILCNERVRVALVTTHLPISKIPEAITKEAILEHLTTFKRSLIEDFGLEAPKIAVLSLNPHSGEEGLLGTEEQDVISPAIAEAKDNKILAFGPFAADGFWGSGQYSKFDGILAMYHDQGLAPFKTIAMESGINYTAGLPYVRTSPDHGTGYDIAGKGVANEDSMRQAIYSAIDILRNRRRHAEATRNPLRRQYYEKGSDNVVLDLTKDVDED
jgi:4-hydroxythreonine-4-phosphate dehydrogenase